MRALNVSFNVDKHAERAIKYYNRLTEAQMCPYLRNKPKKIIEKIY